MEIVKQIDDIVERLFKIQVDLLFSDIKVEDYSEVSEKLVDIKEFLISCKSYTESNTNNKHIQLGQITNIGNNCKNPVCFCDGSCKNNKLDILIKKK